MILRKTGMMDIIITINNAINSSTFEKLIKGDRFKVCVMEKRASFQKTLMQSELCLQS